MKRVWVTVTVVIALLAIIGLAQQAPATGPYKVIKAAKVGGDGGMDYVYADVDGRKLYIPRGGSQQSGATPRIVVYNLDTLEKLADIGNLGGHGVAVSTKSGHGFASSNPVVMFDSKALTQIKTIDVQGSPDGIMYDSFNDRVWVFSHRAPNATVLDPKDGSIVGTVDLGGAPEQAVTDGKGRMYVDLEDTSKIAVVDAKAMKKTGEYDLAGKGGGPAGLAFDVKNHILFASCHEPATMVILNSETGQILDALPIGTGTDGATFNPKTMEAFSSNGGDGTLTVIKENSPTSFVVEQNVKTGPRFKTLTVDTKTDHIFVIGAEYGPPPPPPPADAPKEAQKGGRGRGAPMIAGSFTIMEIGK
ncbi:MAG TPA: YncE family protein [Bryobacteraceae bacterium]|nr:YncE family protein [Bryobacteraceae bacterium]